MVPSFIDLDAYRERFQPACSTAHLFPHPNQARGRSTQCSTCKQDFTVLNPSHANYGGSRSWITSDAGTRLRLRSRECYVRAQTQPIGWSPRKGLREPGLLLETAYNGEEKPSRSASEKRKTTCTQKPNPRIELRRNASQSGSTGGNDFRALSGRCGGAGTGKRISSVPMWLLLTSSTPRRMAVPLTGTSTS